MRLRTTTASILRCCSIACLTAAAVLATGCASGPRGYGAEVPDPLEKVNRGVHAFNQTFDRFLFRPIAKGYDFVTPGPVGTGINNFFVNLRAPLEIANALLQGKFGAAATTTARLLLNTTFGIGGLFDPATASGLERHREDFGQTLAVWGIPSGPYIVLPFLGPATFRDGVGYVGDAYASLLVRPGISISDSGVRDKLLILRTIEIRSQLLDQDKALREAFDPYAFLRSVYIQRREYLIFDGDPPDYEEEFEDEEYEE